MWAFVIAGTVQSWDHIVWWNRKVVDYFSPILLHSELIFISVSARGLFCSGCLSYSLLSENALYDESIHRACEQRNGRKRTEIGEREPAT